jgi:hypothetical protein
MPSLIGVCKLVEARAFDDGGQEVPSPLGPHPVGVAIIDAGDKRRPSKGISAAVGHESSLGL